MNTTTVDDQVKQQDMIQSAKKCYCQDEESEKKSMLSLP